LSRLEPIHAVFVRRRRGRHDILRVTADGAVRVTMLWRRIVGERHSHCQPAHAWIHD
jgi:hypothetical protein